MLTSLGNRQLNAQMGGDGDRSFSSSEQIELRKRELDLEMRKIELSAALEVRRSMIDFEKYRLEHEDERRLQAEVRALTDQVNKKCKNNHDYDVNFILGFSNLLSKVKFGFGFKRTTSTSSLCPDLERAVAHCSAADDASVDGVVSGERPLSRSVEYLCGVPVRSRKRIEFDAESQSNQLPLSSPTNNKTTTITNTNLDTLAFEEKLSRLLKLLKRTQSLSANTTFNDE